MYAFCRAQTVFGIIPHNLRSNARLCIAARRYSQGMHSAAQHAALLGVRPDSSPADIKMAFRRRAMECHPDKGGCTAQFIALQNAYIALSTPQHIPKALHESKSAHGRSARRHSAWHGDAENDSGASDEFEREAEFQRAAYEAERQREAEMQPPSKLDHERIMLGLKIICAYLAFRVTIVGLFMLMPTEKEVKVSKGGQGEMGVQANKASLQEAVQHGLCEAIAGNHNGGVHDKT